MLRRRDGEGLARLMKIHLRGKRPAIAASYGGDGEAPPAQG